MTTAHDLLDYAEQLKEELRDGEYHKAHLQRMKKEGAASQADVNVVEADLEYLRRELRIVLIRAEAIVRGVSFPEAEVSEMTAAVRSRVKREVAA